MKSTVYVPRDSGALSLGADAVATAVQAEAKKRGQELQLIRNGSRGMYWLEPLLEVVTPEGRTAYGPVTRSDVPGLFEAGLLQGA
ncbi:MAG: formate dehydrogenase, partial [Terriglobia bacterium]